jgi:hypothetical protein
MLIATLLACVTARLNQYLSTVFRPSNPVFLCPTHRSQQHNHRKGPSFKLLTYAHFREPERIDLTQSPPSSPPLDHWQKLIKHAPSSPKKVIIGVSPSSKMPTTISSARRIKPLKIIAFSSNRESPILVDTPSPSPVHVKPPKPTLPTIPKDVTPSLCQGSPTRVVYLDRHLASFVDHDISSYHTLL